MQKEFEINMPQAKKSITYIGAALAIVFGLLTMVFGIVATSFDSEKNVLFPANENGVVAAVSTENGFAFKLVGDDNVYVVPDYFYGINGYDKLEGLLAEGARVKFAYFVRSIEANVKIMSLEINGQSVLTYADCRRCIDADNAKTLVLSSLLVAVGTLMLVLAVKSSKKVAPQTIARADYFHQVQTFGVEREDKKDFKRGLISPLQNLLVGVLIGLSAVFVASAIAAYVLDAARVSASWSFVMLLTCAACGVMLVVFCALYFGLRKKIVAKALDFYVAKYDFSQAEDIGKNVLSFGGINYAFTFAGLQMTSCGDTDNTTTIPYNELTLCAEPSCPKFGELFSIWLFSTKEDPVEEDTFAEVEEKFKDMPDLKINGKDVSAEEFAKKTFSGEWSFSEEELEKIARENNIDDVPGNDLPDEELPIIEQDLVLKLNSDIYFSLKRFGVKVEHLDECLGNVRETYFQNVK